MVYFVTRSWTGKPYFVSEWQGYTEDEMRTILKGEPGIIRHDGRWYFTND
nr:MAG TPA: SNF2 Helicase protein [Caudoviricetes sp.]